MSSQDENLCDYTTESIEANSYVTCPTATNPRGTAQQTVVKSIGTGGTAIDREPIVLKLCDDNGIFYRLIEYQDGVAQTPVNIDINGATYNPSGTVSAIGAGSQLTTVYEVQKGATGVLETEWIASGVGGATSSEPLELGFTSFDARGLPLHENPPDATNTITIAQTTNVVTADAPDQKVLDFWLEVPEGGAQIFSFGAGLHSGAIAVSDCDGILKVISYEEDFPVTTSREIMFLDAGFYKFRVFSHDPTASGTHGLRWSINGTGTPAVIPVSNLFLNKPIITKKLAVYNEKTGLIENFDGSTLVGERYLCNPCPKLEFEGIKFDGQARKLKALNRLISSGGTTTYSTNSKTTSVTAVFLEDGVTVTDVDGNVVTYLAGITQTWKSDGESDCLTELDFDASTGSVIITETEVL